MVRAASEPDSDDLQPARAAAPESPASCMNRRRVMPLVGTATSWSTGSRSGDRLQGAGGRDLGMDGVGDDLELVRPALAAAPLAPDERGPGDVGEVGLAAGPVDRADHGAHADR